LYHQNPLDIQEYFEKALIDVLRDQSREEEVDEFLKAQPTLDQTV